MHLSNVKTRPRLVPGLVSITFRALGPEAIIELVQRAGLRAIEWGADVHVPPTDVGRARAVGLRTREAGLAVSSYGSYYKAGRDPHSFAAILQSAVALGAPRIRVWAGEFDAEKADAAQRAETERDLQRIVNMAAGEGIRVAVEFHGGTLTSNAASAVELLRAVEGLETYWQPRVGATPASVLADMQALAPNLCHAHVFQWDACAARYPLSDGAACWPRYLAALSQLDRPLHVQLEYVKDDRPEQLVEDAATLMGWIAKQSAG